MRYMTNSHAYSSLCHCYLLIAPKNKKEYHKYLNSSKQYAMVKKARKHRSLIRSFPSIVNDTVIKKSLNKQKMRG